jgi:hypothetical protein
MNSASTARSQACDFWEGYVLVPQCLEALYSAAAKAAQLFGPPVDEERHRVAQTTGLWLPRATARTAEGVLDPCGLILEIPPKSAYYWCTPKEALTFACTGGDGVHYSYLSSDSLSPGVLPIVMTLPANDRHNYLVAESIEEFLGLGYHVGWFALESIAYEPDAAVQYFTQPEAETPALTDGKSALMEFLRAELDIQPVVLSLDRIAELTERYAQYLVVPDEPDDVASDGSEDLQPYGRS